MSIEMVQYARTDAHYLLYIAHSLIAELEMLDNGTPSFFVSQLLFRPFTFHLLDWLDKKN